MSEPLLEFDLPEDATKYQVLGVDASATQDELHVAYRRMALLYHPDRHAEESKNVAGQVFGRMASAYTTLSDPEKRKRYDRALSRHEEYREANEGEGQISLADILASIGTYEHMFSEGSLREISVDLDDIVERHLIKQLGEEIIDAWALPSAPGGEKHKGTFSKGAVVLTNLRILLPYLFTWEETKGNVKTRYKGAGMPVILLPTLQHIGIIVDKRIRRKLFLDFYFEGGPLRVMPRRSNLSKLLLVAQLWGVPIEARQVDAEREELRWALLRPWFVTLIVLATLFFVTGVIGIFDDGIVDEVGALTEFFGRWGVLQCLVIGVAAISGRRLMLWVSAYSALDLAGSLQVFCKRETESPPTESELRNVA